MYRTRSIWSIAALLCAVLTVALSSHEAASAETLGPPTGGQWLAGPESLASLPARNVRFDGRHLTLVGVAPDAPWFSGFEAGFEDVRSLLRNLFSPGASFDAAVAFTGAQGRHRLVILALSAPRYSARRRDLVLRARVLRGSSRSAAVVTHPMLIQLGTPRGTLPRSLGAAVLYIDSRPNRVDHGLGATPVETSVHTLESEYTAQTREWGRALVVFKECLDLEKNEQLYRLLNFTAVRYRIALGHHREVESLGRTLSEKKPLDAAQLGQLGALEKAYPVDAEQAKMFYELALEYERDILHR